MADQSALTTTSNKSVYSSIQSFESAQRIAASLADSALVPNAYRGQAGLPNCIVAIEIANRMGMSPFQVMQSLNVIHGRPSWSSQFVIGLIETCGRFEGFTWERGEGWSECHAFKKDGAGTPAPGPRITMDMARKEGWTKNSKWQSMPGVMLDYRAATAFGRLYIPDLLLGLRSVEENEVIDAEVTVAPEPTESKLDKVAEILAPKTEPQHVPDPEPPVVGEVDDFFD
jgi:hypothetical protein